MPTFSYKGYTENGQYVDGVIEAYDDIEAMEAARAHCQVVSEVKLVKDTGSFLHGDIGKPRVKAKDFSIMCSQFAIILKAGMPIGRAVKVVADQTSNKYLNKVLTQVASDVQAGHSVAYSFESKGEYLPRVLIETIRAGEESGHMYEGFERMKKYFDRQSKVAGKVASALTYPIFVGIIAVVVVAVLMVMVVPAITDMIVSLGSEIPLMTQILMNISDFVSNNILFIVLFIVLLVVIYKLYARTESGKVNLAKLALRVPIIGVVNRFNAASQFANTMAMLVAAGLPITRCIHVTSNVIDNYVIGKQVGRMETRLEEGVSLTESIRDCDYLPTALIEMTAVGEQSGELEETLSTMGEFYDDETQRVTDRALELLEPIMLVIMAIIAGFIVIALYLPMFQMYAAMS